MNDLIFEPEHLTKETIKKFLCPSASDQELMMGLQIAKTYKLNPLKRELYFVKYGTEPMQVLTGYEVYLKRAERSGKYQGMKAWTEGTIETNDLKACIDVYVKDWPKPLYHEVFYSEYVQRRKDGQINKFWASKPITMIKKVAVSQAFRLAFPDEFDGMPYTADEVIDQEKIIDVQSESTMPGKTLSLTPSQTIEPKTSISTINEPKDVKFNPSDELPITNEQGEALLKLLANNGYNKQDLKEAIFFEFELDKLSKICNKHLPRIKEIFSEKKDVEVSK